MFQLLIEQTIDGNIKKIAKAYEIDLLKQIKFSHIPMDSRSIMTFIEGTCFIRDIPFSENPLSDTETRYNIFHGFGTKWSQIKKLSVESLMNSIDAEVNDFEVSDDCLSFTVKHKEKKNNSLIDAL